ncbi:hypothetical protein Dimus_019201 [Dionaea muscipula]
MESDLGKLFIGGISWDTDEKRLKEYFEQYGEVVEAMIMRDRITGRARGFGFVIFIDPVIAERVVMDKHMIDGRTVEAKKAVPREDQHILSRNNSMIIQGSPGRGRTKKIFVGGLASTVTESDFKRYFDQFGTITDVVVMYDHNTQRPRGFGFITYDSEDAVDRVLYKTFHELNGKMVEVKKAVPKEHSPGPNRSPLVGYTNNNYGLSRASSLMNNYGQGYNLSSNINGVYGRLNPVSIGGRSGFSLFPTGGYGMGMGMGMGMNIQPGFTDTPGTYGRLLGPYYGGSNANRSTPIGYNDTRNESLFSRNVWGSGSLNNPANPFLGSGSGNIGAAAADWGSFPVTSQGGGGSPGGSGNNIPGHGFGDTTIRLSGANYSRNSTGTSAAAAPFAASGAAGLHTGSYNGDLYRGRDSTWRTVPYELEASGSYDLGLSNIAASDIASKPSEGYIGSSYGVSNRQPNGGIAA